MTSAVDAAKEFDTGPCVPEAVRKLLEAFPLAKLCEALSTAKPADREVFISALEKLADFDEVCSNFIGDTAIVTFLRQGANSPDARLTRLVGRLLERLAGSEAGTGMLVSSGLFGDLEILLLGDEVGTAEAAIRTVCKAAMRSAGREAVIGADGFVQRLHAMIAIGSIRETQQIRVLSLFIELGRSSETDIFAALVARGAFKSVLATFLTDDILLKLNGVELMDSLGSYQAGQEFLSQNGVPQQLAADLSDPSCDDSVRLCVVRLLGFVLVRNPSVMQAIMPHQQSPLAKAIATFLDSRQATERLVGLQAVGNIASHQDGLEFFLGWPEVMSTVVSFASSTNNDLCKEAMIAWTSFLARPPPKDGVSGGYGGGKQSETQGPDAEIWKLAMQQVLPAVIKSLSQKPFPDVRACCWRCLAAFAHSTDASRKLLVADEMREKLLDFASETASDAKYAKHEFVQSLVKHQGTWLAAFLDENLEMLLVEYAKQSPFWMPQVSKVNVANQGSG